MAESKPNLALAEGLYDRLKFLAQVLLPGAGTLYFALAPIWALPAADKVVGSITAVDTFLGVLLGFSTRAYVKSGAKYGGQVTLMPNEAEESTDVHFQLEPDSLNNKEVTLKVHRPSPHPKSD